ncbi:MAG: hypothetical protein DRI57_21420 [Deltaproteobacteria bacterium]|nr:MAG: hypothetical protein DRI57_21420 [Deltaproteobacteria bacterium]
MLRHNLKNCAIAFNKKIVRSAKIERSGFLHNKKTVRSAKIERSGFLHNKKTVRSAKIERSEAVFCTAYFYVFIFKFK